jgi:hypothetical protein
MTHNNPLNLAQQLAAQRIQTAIDQKTKLGSKISAANVKQQFNSAADFGKNRLGLINRMRAHGHESKEVLQTTKEVITHRETKIRKLSIEAIDAQIDLLRAELKQRFDTEFAVISERGLAAFAQAQRSFYAVVDAGADIIHDDLYVRVDDISARYLAGRLSDVTYQNELARVQRQADMQISQLEASCAQRMHTLNNTFNT